MLSIKFIIERFKSSTYIVAYDPFKDMHLREMNSWHQYIETYLKQSCQYLVEVVNNAAYPSNLRFLKTDIDEE